MVRITMVSIVCALARGNQQFIVSTIEHGKYAVNGGKITKVANETRDHQRHMGRSASPHNSHTFLLVGLYPDPKNCMLAMSSS